MSCEEELMHLPLRTNSLASLSYFSRIWSSPTCHEACTTFFVANPQADRTTDAPRESSNGLVRPQ